ncbi:DNA-3-methyladenine glycosylase [Candidatus Woesearchaeota archaeon]|nr:DNA-3-methyladenine glycosylase [Candidatus Woesearchaeota archaeon]
MQQLPKAFFAQNTVVVARDLLGKVLDINGMKGRIVETEAYCSDKASHAYKKTDRSALMFDTHGHVYVYMIYGMHHCLNITTDKDNAGAVLIRAVEPLSNLTVMKIRRQTHVEENLCSGPGKLCQSFLVDTRFNGQELGDDVKIYDDSFIPKKRIQTTRIGIKEDVDLPWRFYLDGNVHVSR